jgi:hypothetical protein
MFENLKSFCFTVTRLNVMVNILFTATTYWITRLSTDKEKQECGGGGMFYEELYKMYLTNTIRLMKWAVNGRPFSQ